MKRLIAVSNIEGTREGNIAFDQEAHDHVCVVMSDAFRDNFVNLLLGEVELVRFESLYTHFSKVL